MMVKFELTFLMNGTKASGPHTMFGVSCMNNWSFGDIIRKEFAATVAIRILSETILKQDPHPKSRNDDLRVTLRQLQAGFVISADGQQFKVHRELLIMCSEVLNAIVARDTREANTECLVVEDFPASTVERLVSYLYDDTEDAF